jgi:hypothetical protein
MRESARPTAASFASGSSCSLFSFSLDNEQRPRRQPSAYVSNFPTTAPTCVTIPVRSKLLDAPLRTATLALCACGRFLFCGTLPSRLLQRGKGKRCKSPSQDNNAGLRSPHPRREVRGSTIKTLLSNHQLTLNPSPNQAHSGR